MDYHSDDEGDSHDRHRARFEPRPVQVEEVEDEDLPMDRVGEDILAGQIRYERGPPPEEHGIRPFEANSDLEKLRRLELEEKGRLLAAEGAEARRGIEELHKLQMQNERRMHELLVAQKHREIKRRHQLITEEKRRVLDRMEAESRLSHLASYRQKIETEERLLGGTEKENHPNFDERCLKRVMEEEYRLLSLAAEKRQAFELESRVNLEKEQYLMSKAEAEQFRQHEQRLQIKMEEDMIIQEKKEAEQLQELRDRYLGNIGSGLWRQDPGNPHRNNIYVDEPTAYSPTFPHEDVGSRRPHAYHRTKRAGSPVSYRPRLTDDEYVSHKRPYDRSRRYIMPDSEEWNPRISLRSEPGLQHSRSRRVRDSRNPAREQETNSPTPPQRYLAPDHFQNRDGRVRDRDTRPITQTFEDVEGAGLSVNIPLRSTKMKGKQAVTLGQSDASPVDHPEAASWMQPDSVREVGNYTTQLRVIHASEYSISEIGTEKITLVCPSVPGQEKIDSTSVQALWL
jgi:hypothetical protein